MSTALAANAIVALVGSRGDSFEEHNGRELQRLDKWELIYRQGPWCGLDNVEFATMTYVDWFDHRRLHDRLSCMWSQVSTRERAGNTPSLPSTSCERIPLIDRRGTIPVNVDMSQSAARGKSCRRQS